MAEFGLEGIHVSEAYEVSESLESSEVESDEELGDGAKGKGLSTTDEGLQDA